MDKLKNLIAKQLDSDKASDISIIDLAEKSSLADYMIVATAISQKHIQALAEHIVDKLEALGYRNIPVEGKDGTTGWAVIDAGAIIVHLFREETRHIYNLEKMWSLPAMPAGAAL